MMKNILLLLIAFLSWNIVFAQNENSQERTYGQVAIGVNPETAWKAIKENFAHVGNHHKAIEYAYAMNEEVPFYDGAIRHSQLHRGQFLEESIVFYDEATRIYTTAIDKASAKMLPILEQSVGIKMLDGQTYIYHEVVYKNTTRQAVAKIKKWNRAYLKAYKEVVEEMMHKEPKLKQFQSRLSSMLYE